MVTSRETAAGRLAASPGARGSIPARVALEALAVAALPVVLYFVLRLQLMPVPDINDPAMHTTFIVDPRDYFERYSDLLTPTARLREGARAGLLVPARVAYLLFGPVGGFVAFRYVLALVAIAPAYVLMRRLAGVAAGLTAAAVVMTCPVIITAWGSDYPDSASVSYLIGGLAMLAMPSAQHRARWAAGAVFLLTMAIWAFATSLVFAGIFGTVYLALRWWRARQELLRDVVVFGGVIAATTVLLGLASWALLGQLDFIRPTIRAIRFLSQPSQEVLWHSTSWSWAPYDTYLLVLPVVALAWIVSGGWRPLRLPTPHLQVGVSFVLAVAAAAFLQFFGKLQMLEEHYFVSLSWAAAMLTLSLVLVVVGRPLLEQRLWRWSLPAAVVVIVLVFEAAAGLWSSAWSSGAGVVAIAAVMFIGAGVVVQRARTGRRIAVLALLCAFDASILAVTIAPVTPHTDGPGVIFDPTPHYAAALGGGQERAVDMYRVSTELPAFVGPARYPGERLMMWWPLNEEQDLFEPIGMFHAYFNSVLGTFGQLDNDGKANIEARRPALVLLMSPQSDKQFQECVASLSPYGATVEKEGTLSSGSYSLHVWLVRLTLYSK